MPKPTILIVDDNEIVRMTISSLLKSDYNLYTADSGNKALMLAEETNPDLIFLDIMMPGIDGFEVCRKIREHTTLAEIPIIMITGLDDADSKIKGIEAGADDFITKPFNRIELLARAKNITRMNRYRRLNDERKRFEWVVAESENGYLIVDMNDYITYANPKASLLLNLPEMNHMDSRISFLAQVKKLYRCEPLESWDEYEETRQTPGTLFLMNPESGTSHSTWLSVKFNKQDSQVNPMHLIRIKDITQQMQNRRGAWTFHTMIQHKLTAPLNTLLGALDILAGDRSIEEPNLKFLIGNALNGAQKLSGTIQDILKYIDQSKFQEKDNICSLRDISSIINTVSKDLRVRIFIECPIANPENVTMNISKRAIELVVLEILKNSWQFHPERDPIVNISYAIKPERIEIAFADNGIHLSPEQLAKAFIPYYQGEKHHTGEMRGMGLGLSMVASLIWESDGHCEIKNRPQGPGVIVNITIPLPS